MFFAQFLLSGIMIAIRQHALYKYLKNNVYDRWCELTSIGRFGPGLLNSWRGIRYIYSDRDSALEEVRLLKDSIKIWIRYLVCGYLAAFVNIGLIVWIARAHT